ncbi:hypothetical protein [Microbulbifer sp. SSSA005]|uniref:hypothetical protein n=1 Tax=Microbulbifer sp. SSSA005 TaxID=3243378 RepID=UPI00403A163E
MVNGNDKKKETKAILIKLSQDPLFRHLIFGSFVVLFIIAIVILILLAISQDPQYNFAPNYQGFENLVRYLTPAFKAFAGVLVLAGVRGMVFRSEQTAQQLNLAYEQLNHANRLWEHEQQKSSYSNYLDHKERYENFLNQIKKNQKVVFTDKTKLYKACFPNSRISDFKISIDNMGSGESRLFEAIQTLNELCEAEAKFCKTKSIIDYEIEQQIDRTKKLYDILEIFHIDSYARTTNLDGVNLNQIQNAIAVAVNGLLSLSASEERVSENVIGIGHLYPRFRQLKHQLKHQLKKDKGYNIVFYFTDIKNPNTVRVVEEKISQPSPEELV